MRALRFFLCLLAGWVAGAAVAAPSIPGGYSPAPITKEVKAAATFAVRQQAKTEKVALELTAINRAQQQVVAGLNYRLALSLTRDGKSASAVVVVYRDLGNHLQLTSWKWVSGRAKPF